MTKRPYGSGSVYVYTAANGRRSWYGRWRTPGGRQKKKRLGAVRDGRGPGLTRLQAEQELGRLLLLADDRDAGGPDVHATISDTGDDLLAHLAEIGRKRSTISSYESMLRVHLAPYFGSTLLRDIRRRDIETFARAKHREGSSSKTIRNLLGVLHTLFQHARRQDWVETNPVSLAHRPRARGEKDIRFLTLTELDRVLAKIDPNSTYGAVDRAMVLTAAHTGLRKGELCGLRWSDVDLAARRLRVRRSFVRGEFDTPKSARGSRSVPISTPLAGALETWRKTTFYSEDDDLVFAHPLHGRPLPEAMITRRFQAHAKLARVRADVRFHDLRHTFGTTMAASGVPMRTLQEWMGHRDLQTTLIYADYVESPHETAMVDQAFHDLQN